MEVETFTLATPGVLEKLMEAGRIAQKAMELAISKCVPEADVHSVCKEVHEAIMTMSNKAFSKSKFEKGPAFPVCISLNDVAGHFCPLADESVAMKEGDVAKIDLGVHLDGFPAVLAHTVVVGGAKTEDDKRLLSGGFNGLQVLLKSIGPGKVNHKATENMCKVLADYKVSPLEGVLSHELGKYALNGEFCIGGSDSVEHQVKLHEMRVNEIYALDVLVSENPKEGKTKQSEMRTTCFKRNIDETYDLKTKMARAFLNDIKTNCHDFGFSISFLKNQLEARVGSSECLKTGHLEPFPVIQEKSKARVAHFKWTVAISNKRLILLAGRTKLEFEMVPVSEALLKNEDLKEILTEPLENWTKKKKNRKKK